MRWRDPPLDDQNGLIVHYVVRHFPANDSSSVKEEVEAAEAQDDIVQHAVNHLQPFTTYEFIVAAATNAGRGPFSNPSTVRMPPDGKLEPRGTLFRVALCDAESIGKHVSQPAMLQETRK